jgi:PAS domain S-box-containing protein
MQSTFLQPRRSLTRRLSRLLAISTTVLLICILAIGLTITHLSEELGRGLIVTNVDKVRGIITSQMAAMDRLIIDYAYWDDTVHHITTPDSAWFAEQFTSYFPKVHHLDLILLLDARGTLVYQYGNAPGFRAGRPIPDSTLMTISQNQPTFHGGWRWGGKYYLIAGSGVYRSVDLDAKQRSAGTLVFGHVVDSNHLDGLGALARERLTLCELSGEARPLVSGSEKAQTSTSRRNGYCVARGLDNKPMAFMRVTSELPQLDRLKASVYFMLEIVAISLILGSVFLIWTMQRRVIRPIRHIREALDRFRRGESVDWRGLLQTGDDFEALTAAFGEVSDALRKSERSLLTMVEGAADAVVVMDSEGWIQLANIRARELFGLNADVIEQCHVLDLVPHDSKPALQRYMRTLLRTRAFFGELTLMDSGGRAISAEVNSIVLNDGRLFASARDVTARKHVEQALRESEENFRTIADVIPSCLWMMTADWENFLYASPAFQRVYGYSPEQLQANPKLWFDAIHPDDAPFIRTQIQMVGDRKFENEHRIIRPDGEIRWVHNRVSPVRDGNGQLIRLIGMTEDTTVRKTAELELRDSEERYRVLVESQAEGVISGDLEEKFDFANSAAERILGVAAGELVGMSFRDFLSDEQFRFIQQQTELRKAGQRGQYELEIIRPDGTKRSLLITGNPRFNDQGELIGTFGVFEDITERKQAEANLRASEGLLRATLESTGDGLLVVDSEGRMTHANARYADLWRIPASLMHGGSHQKVQDYIAEQLENPEQYLSRVRELCRSREVETVCVDLKDGRVIERYSCPLMQDGKNAGRVWSFRDVSDSRRAEAALRESEERFRNLADTAPVLIWMAGVERHCYYFNKTWLTFTGHSMQAEYGKGWMKGVHPDDLKQCVDTYAAAFKTHRAFSLEFRLSHADGTYHWVFDTGTPRHSPDGRFTGYIGTCIDITDRKLAEEANREGEQRLRAIFQSIPDAVFLKNTNREYTHINLGMEKLLKLPASRLIGRNDEEIFEPASAAQIREADLRVLRGEPVETLSSHMIQGVPVMLHVTKVPMRDQDGHITGICGVARDVTKQQETVERKFVQDQYYSAVVDNLRAGVLVVEATSLIIREANPEALRLFGAGKEQVVGGRYDRYVAGTLCGTRPDNTTDQIPAFGDVSIQSADGRVMSAVESIAEVTIGSRPMYLIGLVAAPEGETPTAESSTRELQTAAQSIRQILPDGSSAVTPEAGGLQRDTLP